MSLLSVNRDTCTKCGACAAVCPPGIIYFREGNRPRQLPGTDEVCIRCGHCVAVCPAAAMDNAEAPLNAATPVDTGLGVTYEQMEQLVRARRSIREFQDREVPREEIEKLIYAARYAPTGHNNQGVKWHVITGRETLKKLAVIGMDWMRWTVEKDPAMTAMMAGVIKRQESGFDEFLRGAPVVVMACVEKENVMSGGDCAIALAYFDLLAGAAGLGCCWGGFFNNAAASFTPMTEAVGVPDGLSPRGALMVGYPRYAYPRIPYRKPAEISWRP
jgi:nitroreductase/NAD-dependent dihydropyrimidine dehydrogenase PreA subunit